MAGDPSNPSADVAPQRPVPADRDERGKFRKGNAANPGGQPKWIRALRKELSKGAPDAARLLLGLMRGDIRNVVRTEEGDLIEVDPQMKDRLKAAELWFTYCVPKPKQEVEATVNEGRALPGFSKEELLEIIRADKEPAPH